MISKQYIKKLGFRQIEDIFYYIVESEINGAIAQAKELINKLSDKQFFLFIQWLSCDGHPKDDQQRQKLIFWRY